MAVVSFKFFPSFALVLGLPAHHRHLHFTQKAIENHWIPKSLRFRPPVNHPICSGERDVVLHVPYLEMSDRDQMPSTFTWFTRLFGSASRVFVMEVFS